MTNLTFLHTADAHCARFDALAAQISKDGEHDISLVHHVHSDWLAQARAGGIDALRTPMGALIRGAEGPVICTCTTLGPLAEDLGAVRVDHAMMAQAATDPGQILLVSTLQSTKAPSRAYLHRHQTAKGTQGKIHDLDLSPFWSLFEAREYDAFAACIAGGVRAYLADHPAITTVVLAQVSMADAAPLLADAPARILSAPICAMRAALT